MCVSTYTVLRAAMVQLQSPRLYDSLCFSRELLSDPGKCNGLWSRGPSVVILLSRVGGGARTVRPGSLPWQVHPFPLGRPSLLELRWSWPNK